MFIDNNLYGWDRLIIQNGVIHYRGDITILLETINKHRSIKKDELFSILKNFSQNNQKFLSFVIETTYAIYAFTDHIRTWPVFYSTLTNAFFISPCASIIKDSLKDSLSINQNASLEFSMSGYVTGNETLYNQIGCLQPGQILLYDKETKTIAIERYYQYRPNLYIEGIDQSEAIKDLDGILNEVVKEILVRAGKSLIWVPLSGGLDSRLILCKLHQHGAKNVQTFSYGPSGNFETRIARKVARKLNYSWRDVRIPSKIQRQYFDSQERKDFWAFASGFKAIPCMREYSAIRYLRECNIMPADSIIINGQSGDYISGGHIHDYWHKNPCDSTQIFQKLIIDKHYDLWSNLKTQDNLEVIKVKLNTFLSAMGFSKDTVPHTLASLSETWEYDARQCCYVVNGQRIYEYSGYRWEMPLWDRRLVNFYENIPFSMKFNQDLWKTWLKKWNYNGLFPEKEPYIWRWPLPMLWVVLIAKFIKILVGEKFKIKFYNFMKYFGHYHNQYQFLKFSDHIKTYSNSRNVISMLTREFIKENSELFSANIKRKLKI